MHSARSVTDWGWLPGSGTALLAAEHEVRKLVPLNEAERAGIEAVAKTLEHPLHLLVGNSGADVEQALAQVREKAPASIGFNAATNSVEDLAVSGILDSAEVVQASLMIAWGYAKSLLTTNVSDLIRRQDNPRASGPAMRLLAS